MTMTPMTKRAGASRNGRASSSSHASVGAQHKFAKKNAKCPPCNIFANCFAPCVLRNIFHQNAIHRSMCTENMSHVNHILYQKHKYGTIQPHGGRSLGCRRNVECASNIGSWGNIRGGEHWERLGSAHKRLVGILLSCTPVLYTPQTYPTPPAPFYHNQIYLTLAPVHNPIYATDQQGQWIARLLLRTPIIQPATAPHSNPPDTKTGKNEKVKKQKQSDQGQIIAIKPYFLFQVLKI